MANKLTIGDYFCTESFHKFQVWKFYSKCVEETLFFLIIKEINILLKNDGDNPVLLRRYIKKTRVHFYRLFHHEANAYNADRPNNEIHENWCWTKTGWTPLMASILFLGCRIYGCLGFFCGVVSISTLALMSFSRYIHVCKSSKCKGFFLIFRSEFVSRILVVVVNLHYLHANVTLGIKTFFFEYISFKKWLIRIIKKAF